MGEKYIGIKDPTNNKKLIFAWLYSSFFFFTKAINICYCYGISSLLMTFDFITLSSDVKQDIINKGSIKWKVLSWQKVFLVVANICASYKSSFRILLNVTQLKLQKKLSKTLNGRFTFVLRDIRFYIVCDFISRSFRKCLHFVCCILSAFCKEIWIWGK